jgi:putative ABC transport system ATP-binding protein
MINNPTDIPVLRAQGLTREFGKAAGLVRAVDGVDLDVVAGETVAVMGPTRILQAERA